MTIRSASYFGKFRSVLEMYVIGFRTNRISGSIERNISSPAAGKMALLNMYYYWSLSETGEIQMFEISYMSRIGYF